MSFIETVEKARGLLERNGRLSLRALQREFDLGNEVLEDLVEELVDVQQVAAREGKVLSWIGVAHGEVSEAKPEPQVVAETSPELGADTGPGATRHPVEAERRQLTVLFCDLVGSTALASRLDAEDWRDVVRQYQSAAAAAIERFEGHVAQYLGDGLLVYFGYPRAHEEDAERAVRAGLAVVDSLAELNPSLEERHSLRLSVRVGIHTGPVVIGEMGGGDHQVTLAVGDTTNLAARLQEVADSNAVVVSAETLRLVRGIFVTEDLGAHPLKGIPEAVTLHRVVATGGVRSRLDLAAKLTPLVARQEELGLLLGCWERVQDGEGHAVLVLGEAGVGKSRLVRALRERLVEEGSRTWLECRGSPFAANSPFHPVIELLQQEFSFAQSDPPESKLRKLEAGLDRVGLALAETSPLFMILLGIPLPERYAALELSPELRRRKTLAALVAWALALAKRQPAVLLIEDLHWIDPSTLDFLEMLIEQSPTARMLTLMTARPEFDAPWPAGSHWTSLTLARLTPRQAQELANSLSLDRALPEAALLAIVARADGIPLYLEELTKGVLESGLLVEQAGRYALAGDVAELAIPTTLQDSLMARLDRLSSAKRVAQVASALGREFSYPLLAAVAEEDEPTLRLELARLVEAELVFQGGSPPSATYTFKHALIRDTAYESLLRSVREQLHGRIADVLEAQFPERAVAEPEFVAHHYDQAGRVTEAVCYYQRAGDAARDRFSNQEAIAHLKRGVELASRLPEGEERDNSNLRLHVSLGWACSAAYSFASEDTGRAWERTRDLCQRAGSPEQLAAALAGLSLFHENRSELDAAMQLGEELLALGRRTKDDIYVLAGTYRAGNAKFWRGRLRECLEDHNAVLALYDQMEPKGWEGIIAAGDIGANACGAHASLALWTLGYPDQAIARVEEGLARARALDHALTLAAVLLWASICHSVRGEWKIAARRAEECAEESERRGSPQFVGISGVIRAHAIAQSQGRDTLAEAMEGLGEAAETGQLAGAPFILWLIARIHQEMGREADALGSLESALAASEQTGQPFLDAELLRQKGDLSLPSDEAEAETLFLRALEVAQRQEAKSFELRAATSLARLWQRQGKRDEARDLLQPAYDWFTEGFDTPDLKDAKALLDELA